MNSQRRNQIAFAYLAMRLLGDGVRSIAADRIFLGIGERLNLHHGEMSAFRERMNLMLGYAISPKEMMSKQSESDCSSDVGYRFLIEYLFTKEITLGQNTRRNAIRIGHKLGITPSEAIEFAEITTCDVVERTFKK